MPENDIIKDYVNINTNYNIGIPQDFLLKLKNWSRRVSKYEINYDCLLRSTHSAKYNSGPNKVIECKLYLHPPSTHRDIEARHFYYFLGLPVTNKNYHKDLLYT